MAKPRIRTAQFTTGAKWLHWLVAVLLISIISVAIGFSYLDPADRAEALPVHVSLGLIVLALTFFRLGWRAVFPPPEVPPGAPAWTRAGAQAGHFMLYALVLFQGALGILMAAASPVDIRFFNGADISALAPPDPALIATLAPLHLAGAWLFAAVLVGHVLGALWHHLVLRDDVLLRMLPFSGLADRINAEHRARRAAGSDLAPASAASEGTVRS
jgi:cytochrome b561